MVHMVQGRQHSVCTVCKPHGCQHLNHRDGVWDRLLTSIVTSFNALITGDELDSALNFRSLVAWHACVMLFIHGITSAKRTHEVRPAVLIRESSTQLLIYSLDTCVRYSTYLLIFMSQKGSMEALNFRVITPRACTRGKVIGCVVIVIVVVVSTKIAISRDVEV